MYNRCPVNQLCFVFRSPSEKQASPITNYLEMSAANEVTLMVPSGKLFFCIWPETFYRRHSSQIIYMVRTLRDILPHFTSSQSPALSQLNQENYCFIVVFIFISDNIELHWSGLHHDRQGFSCKWCCKSVSKKRASEKWFCITVDVLTPFVPNLSADDV